VLQTNADSSIYTIDQRNLVTFEGLTGTIEHKKTTSNQISPTEGVMVPFKGHEMTDFFLELQPINLEKPWRSNQKPIFKLVPPTAWLISRFLLY